MDSYEFGLWVAEYNRAPWGEYRSDLQAGIVAATVANTAGRMLQEGVTVSPADYMPFIERPKAEADELEEVKRMAL